MATSVSKKVYKSNNRGDSEEGDDGASYTLVER